jgi:N-carbamoylputrescine amidase
MTSTPHPVAESILRLAVLQARLGGTRDENNDRIESMVRQAAADGARLILPPELFDGPYFPRVIDDAAFASAAPLDSHPTVLRFESLAAELGVVVPISVFERDADRYFNTLVLSDAGRRVAVYRKSHIPDGPGYEEKHYFSPGDTGFGAWDTSAGRVGPAVCWDQWFPEGARSMALAGAEILLYPTAIGSEPNHPDQDTRDPWRRVMVGHAVANSVPVAAANRVGDEDGQRFYGSSFVCNGRGDVLAELGRDAEGILRVDIDRAEAARYRQWFGLARDRRPDLYGALTDPVSRG